MFALNHWQTAVDTHSRNFPHATHVNSRLDQTSPSECGRIDLLFASPECTHHSRARGGRPTSDQQRAGAWDVLKWLEFHRPSWLVVENVVEFEQWGPVGDNGKPLVTRRGAFFHAWIAAIEAAGYRVGWRQLNAADYGATTSRNRLFVVARKGRRSPVFPEPTHSRKSPSGAALPGMEGLRLPQWRAAAEVIDWSIPCPSIFSRKRPLAPKTLARIEAGLRRFVGPFVASWTNGSTESCEYDPAKPMPTVLTKAHMGLAMPYIVRSAHGDNGSHRIEDLGKALPTLTTSKDFAIAVPFTVEVNHAGGDSRTSKLDTPVGTMSTKNGRGLVLPYLVPNFGERDGQPPRTHSVADACPAITGHGAGQLVVPFLSHFYGNGHSSPVGSPVDTITTRDRHALVTASLLQTMAELHVVDIGFRMLQNHELAAAQGFPASYVFCGSKAAVTRQIGNSVAPPVAAAITRAIAGAV
jgi:DNA (cytosine-5)-methyltransferase 1